MRPRPRRTRNRSPTNDAHAAFAEPPDDLSSSARHCPTRIRGVRWRPTGGGRRSWLAGKRRGAVRLPAPLFRLPPPGRHRISTRRSISTRSRGSVGGDTRRARVHCPRSRSCPVAAGRRRSREASELGIARVQRRHAARTLSPIGRRRGGRRPSPHPDRPDTRSGGNRRNLSRLAVGEPRRRRTERSQSRLGAERTSDLLSN